MPQIVVVILVTLLLLADFVYSRAKPSPTTNPIVTRSTKGGAESSEQNAPSFKSKKIKVGHRAITVEIADTDERRRQGLMFRESLPKDHGMLFIFEKEMPLSFWMKNTLIPLSIAFFDGKRILINIEEMSPPIVAEVSFRTYASRRNAKFALEMAKGWFSRNGIEPGARLEWVD